MDPSQPINVKDYFQKYAPQLVEKIKQMAARKRKSPSRSPKRSRSRSPSRSPKRSRSRSPKRSPKRSPRRRARSPSMSPGGKKAARILSQMKK